MMNWIDYLDSMTIEEAIESQIAASGLIMAVMRNDYEGAKVLAESTTFTTATIMTLADSLGTILTKIEEVSDVDGAIGITENTLAGLSRQLMSMNPDEETKKMLMRAEEDDGW